MNIGMLKYVVDANNLLQYEVNGAIHTIPFSAILSYWKYATADDFEGGHAYVSGLHIIGFITVASGQGGVIFVWNAITHKIEHISDGAYVISVILYHNMIYSLCVITNYFMSAKFCLYKIEFGTKDIDLEACVVKFNCSYSIDEYNGDYNSIRLIVYKDKLYLSVDGVKHQLKITGES